MVVGDTITAITTVSSFVEGKPWIAMCQTQCFNQQNDKVIDGTATIHLPWLRDTPPDHSNHDPNSRKE